MAGNINIIMDSQDFPSIWTELSVLFYKLLLSLFTKHNYRAGACEPVTEWTGQ